MGRGGAVQGKVGSKKSVVQLLESTERRDQKESEQRNLKGGARAAKRNLEGRRGGRIKLDKRGRRPERLFVASNGGEGEKEGE